VIVSCKFGDACILVENVLGQRKVVVNALNDKLRVVDSVAGVAQLGGGRLSIVLSAPDLVKTISSPALLA
jgi:chemotaxis protein histidine kinase CheA